MKLESTCIIRFLSASTIICGELSSKRNPTASSCFLCEQVEMTSRQSRATSTLVIISSTVPASILEISKMSEIRLSSSSLFSSTRDMYDSRSSSSASASRLEKPTIAFSGVRISWLMFARNADFSLSDSSAFSFAKISSSSTCLRVVISVANSMIAHRPSSHFIAILWMVYQRSVIGL